MDDYDKFICPKASKPCIIRRVVYSPEDIHTLPVEGVTQIEPPSVCVNLHLIDLDSLDYTNCVLKQTD